MTLTADLLRRYDRPGPRYTSYPTAVELHDGVGAIHYAAHLARAAASDEPLSLYLHLPFCAERCLYCGCHALVTPHREVAARYLGALGREIGEVAARLAPRRRLRQLHWGGGTPTYLEPDQLRALHAAVASAFEIEAEAEVAVEVDPRAASFDHLATLRELGFNRLSIGVQDFDPAVQTAVRRIQPFEPTRDLVVEARRLGFGSLNVDLIYGLPGQTPEGFRATLERVLELRPERAAVYGYAHVPWLKPHQRRLPETLLPGPAMRITLLAGAIEAFRDAGYLAIGMDHFALPEDELGRALEAGTLWRNFMGYTVRAAPDTIACGTSAISDVAGGYFQDERKLGRYERAALEGRLPVERGFVLDDDDLVRRHLITDLLCNFRIDVREVERRWEIDFGLAFARELAALRSFEADGLVRVAADEIAVVGDGRLLVRNVAMVFDAYRREPEDATVPRFSRTV